MAKADPVPSQAVQVRGLRKTYASGLTALRDIELSIHSGEIFALLGPNGAGKTTLISIICGIVTPGEGEVLVAGHDIVKDYRKTRSLVGLVPQELATDSFETVWATTSFSRGLFGLPRKDAHIEKVLRDLSLWDKRNEQIKNLSGGMKRRVMIAKALAHEPRILFLDEPSAGVDVELRRDMWALVHDLRRQGVTIILTTHYIEEAEQMADRVGVISQGALILVEEKHTLMRKLGRKELSLNLIEPLSAIPDSLSDHELELVEDGWKMVYHYDIHEQQSDVAGLMTDLDKAGIRFTDLHTRQSSLEEIFVNLVRGEQ